MQGHYQFSSTNNGAWLFCSSAISVSLAAAKRSASIAVSALPARAAASVSAPSA